MQAGGREELCQAHRAKPLNADLAELKLGSLTLTPTFSAATAAYAATTTNASNTLTVAATDERATLEVKLGTTAVTAGQDGKYTLDWAAGENTVTVKVTCGSLSKTYTITVTKS